MDLNQLFKTQWDRTTAVILAVLGAIFLLFGWIGVSGTPYLAEQASYIVSGGVGGIFLLGLGATLWLSADLRDEWRKLDRIERALGDGTLSWTIAPTRPTASTGPAGPEDLGYAPPAPEAIDVTSDLTPLLARAGLGSDVLSSHNGVAAGNGSGGNVAVARNGSVGTVNGASAKAKSNGTETAKVAAVRATPRPRTTKAAPAVAAPVRARRTPRES